MALIAFPMSKLEDLVSLLVFGMILKKRSPLVIQAKELVRASLHINSNGGANLVLAARNPFMREAFSLFKKEYMNATELKSVLLQRSDYFKKSYMSDAKTLNALAKFPPAFGLLGASTGMITMMSSIGQGQQDKIGSAMAIALVATFWGIAVANFLILPLADYASRMVQEDQHTRSMIIDGIVMIKEGADTNLVLEKVLAYLPPTDRSALEIEVPKMFQAHGATVIPFQKNKVG